MGNLIGKGSSSTRKISAIKEVPDVKNTPITKGASADREISLIEEVSAAKGGLHVHENSDKDDTGIVLMDGIHEMTKLPVKDILNWGDPNDNPEKNVKNAKD